MPNELKSRLLNITDEVRELHPLLETIFHKMPTLMKVEYTHGPNERGADFILTKESAEFGDTEYVGVIVKVGKITQGMSSVTEQIEECTLRRLSPSGKKEIYLSEIWVVANGTITEGAKEKIWAEYKTQKIKFVDINLLTKWTQSYVPDYGVEINIQDYNLISKQRELCVERELKFSLLPKEGSPKHLTPEIIHIDDEFSPIDMVRNIFEKVEKSKFLSIESQMGGGKTKLLNSMVEHFSDIEMYKDKRICPIYLTSKEAIHSKKTLSELIKGKVEEFDLKDDERRKYLVLIDGLDEAKPNDTDISTRVISLIDEVENSENIKLVIASRDITNEIIEKNSCFRKNRYRIKPLKLNGMIKFLEELCAGVSIRTRLLEDLKKSDLFKVLPKTPIAAIILAKLISEGSEELPMNLTELYAKYCELSLGRWDIDKGLKTQKQYEALDAIVSNIASYMLLNELPSLSKAEAKQKFKDYLDERNLKIDSDALFDEMLERSSILVKDDAKGTIAFKHRSFAEFFFAKQLINKQKVEINSDIFHPYWTNSFFFYVGLKKDCPELLEEIITLPVEHEGMRLSRLVNMGSLLLAGYQSPYWVIEKGIDSIFTDAGKYFTEVREGQTESFLSVLPPLHLLSVFHNIIEEGYAYKFLKEAIVKSIEENSTKKSDCESLPYSLFFLDSMRYKLGGGELFDNLIELYNGKLPTLLDLAVGHEAKRVDYSSPVIKKVQKRLAKNCKKSIEFRTAVVKLYEESIDGTKKISTNSQKRLR